MTTFAVHPLTLPCTVWQGRLTVWVLKGGEGPPLVYFHSPWGLQWDPFLGGLARHYTVYAPYLPGTGEGDPNDIYKVDSLWDLVLIMGDVLDALGLQKSALVGHSFGGMLALEVCAHWPERCRGLVAIAPIGLWREEHPIANWMAVLHQQDLVRLLFRNPSSPAVAWVFPTFSDPQQQALAQAKRI
ncbi:Dihydrolipoyllysine-residue acetyltransferase component of acetoin cleaving system [bacterium HR23]|nr:Dihydrolipoyllysine-residue acetyltransferase component of acetoin cleaving system [bacterium HR23]